MIVPYFLAYMAASTGGYYDYRMPTPVPRMRHEMNVAYRTFSDCLIAAEALNNYYRRWGSSYLISGECGTTNPNDHR